MKTMKKYGDKILSCIPEKWADFYRKAPSHFDQGFLDKMGITRREFIEFAELTSPNNTACGLFDYYYFKVGATDLVYKNEVIYSSIESWLLNKDEMMLYNAMPDVFSPAEFRSMRIALGLPIRYQDRMYSGSLFKHILTDEYDPKTMSHNRIESKYFRLGKKLLNQY